MTTPPPAPARKVRNPIERLIVWGGITLLVVVVVIEYRAKQSYDTSVEQLQNAANGLRDVPLDEARTLLVGYTSETGPATNDKGFQTYHYRWFSLFRGGTYQLTLVANADQKTLQTFDGPGFAEDPATLAAQQALHDSAPLGPPPMIGTRPPEDPSLNDEPPASAPPTSQTGTNATDP